MADLEYWRGKRVVVTGGAGFIGGHVVENLVRRRAVDPSRIVVPRSAGHDLRLLHRCREALDGADVVIHLAAVTGGIAFSRAHPAAQYYDSTLIDLNVAEAARRAGVKKLVAIGNLFAYSPDAPLPLSEDHLFDGLPGEAHRGVGVLKRNLAVIADVFHREHGLPMVVVYSANGYGPGDSLDPAHSHVIPSLIMKCLRDRELVVWGDGTATRDFLFVADIAEALLRAAESLEPPGYVNIGSGREVTVREVVELIARHTGFSGPVTFDASKGGGEQRRVASPARASQRIGFSPRVPIDEGLRRTVAWYRERLASPAQSVS